MHKRGMKRYAEDQSPAETPRMRSRREERKEKGHQLRDHFLVYATSVFASNIPLSNCGKTRIKKLFGQFGIIVEVNMCRIPDKYQTAQIFFRKRKDAEASLVLNGQKIDKNVIHVYLEVPEIQTYKNEEVTEAAMEEKFRDCGKIKLIRIVETVKGRDAYICFEDPESVSLATKS